MTHPQAVYQRLQKALYSVWIALIYLSNGYRLPIPQINSNQHRPFLPFLEGIQTIDPQDTHRLPGHRCSTRLVWSCRSRQTVM